MNLFITISIYAIVLPIFVWLYRIKELSKLYHIFAFHLVAGLINETVHQFFKVNLIGQISSQFYSLIETQCILYVFLKWGGESRKATTRFQIAFLLLWIIECCIHFTMGGGIYMKWLYLLELFVLIIYGVKLISIGNYNITRSQKLIIIPYIIFSIYYIVINLLMYWLYNKSNQPFFIQLYAVIDFINLLSYISYSLALIWVPKKEKFL